MPSPSNAKADAVPLVGVWITPTLEADYTRRGVFSHLRIKDAPVRNGYQGRFDLSLEEARELFEDAKAQTFVSRGVAGRGTTTAYSMLATRLREHVVDQQEQPVQPAASVLNPGALARIQRQERLSRAMLDALEASPARFRVGQKARLYGLEEDLEIEIVDEFGAYLVDDDPQYRLGYVVKYPSGKEYFHPAADVAHLDGRAAHLRLVRVAGRASP